jgi:hypothetical protein
MSLFRDKLYKGETVFFEIVGYEEAGKPIMPSGNTNSSEFSKEFKAAYGEKMNWSYGFDPTKGEHKIFVYRMTMTNEDGVSIDYTWDAVVQRCAEMGVDHVPVLMDIHHVPNFKTYQDYEDFCDEWLLKAETLATGPSTIDSTHIREGVIFKLDHAPIGTHALTTKHKSYDFKVVEGMIKDSGEIDMEEADGVLAEAQEAE